jgi:uncharacterized integral membrane protein
MRSISNFISLLLFVALVVGLVAFSIGNGTLFALSFFGYTFYHVPVWLPTVVGAVVGFLLAFFVLTPGRLRGAWENNRLRNRISRHEAASEKELSDLRQSTAVASEKELSDLRQSTAEASEKELSDLRQSTAEASEKELSDLRQSTAVASEKELSDLRQKNAELEQENKLNRNSTE